MNVVITTELHPSEWLRWEFPGSPVVRTLLSQPGPGFDPWSGN